MLELNLGFGALDGVGFVYGVDSSEYYAFSGCIRVTESLLGTSQDAKDVFTLEG